MTLPTKARATQRTRGALYVNKARLKAWQQVIAIAHEQERSDAEVHELMTEVTGLAIAQYLARKSEGLP